MRKLFVFTFVAALVVMTIPAFAGSGFKRGSGFNEGILEMSDYPIEFDERSGDPAVPLSDTIQVYAKDSAGTTKLYTQDALGTVTELGSGTETDPYAVLLAGRSGGQIVKGGTGEGENLSFWTNATGVVGHYYFTDLTDNGFLKTSGGTGVLSVDTNTYLTGNQTITLSGDVTGSGATSIVTAVADDSHNHTTSTLPVTTSVGSPGSDANIPTEKAVRSAISAAGGGDVSGPAGAVSGNIPQFADATGKLLEDSGKAVGAFLESETDPVFTAVDHHGNWDTAYGWGDHSTVGYLTAETDPVFTAVDHHGNWDDAYGWGNHADAGYLTTVTADTPLSGSGTSGSHLVIANSAADGSTKGAATFTAADFDASSGVISLDSTKKQIALQFYFNGHGSAVAAGTTAITPGSHTAFDITGWRVNANASGNCVIDINFGGSSAAGTEKPTISGASSASDTSLTTWTDKTVAVGDSWQAEVDSCDVTEVTVSVFGTKS